MIPTYSYVVNFEARWGNVNINEDVTIEHGGERMTTEQVVEEFERVRWEDDVIVSITELEHTTRSTEIWSRGA